jgi:hypothetical protein
VCTAKQRAVGRSNEVTQRWRIERLTAVRLASLRGPLSALVAARDGAALRSKGAMWQCSARCGGRGEREDGAGLRADWVGAY